MLNGANNKVVGDTQSWVTPKWLVDALGGPRVFDLDPCCPEEGMPWRTAKQMWRFGQRDGLVGKWEGRVWLNPPYDRRGIEKWMLRMAEHANGIALVYARTDVEWCQKRVFPVADSILFLAGRLTFAKPDGTPAPSPAGVPSMLVSYDAESTKLLLAAHDRVLGRMVCRK